VALTRQVVALLSRGSSIPEDTRPHRRKRCESPPWWSLLGDQCGRLRCRCRATRVGHTLGCALLRVSGWLILVIHRWYFYQGYQRDFGRRRAVTTLSMTEWLSRRIRPLREILVLVRRRPGGARPRREDEGLCLTSVHRLTRQTWDRLRLVLLGVLLSGQVSLPAIARGAPTHRASSGCTDANLVERPE